MQNLLCTHYPITKDFLQPVTVHYFMINTSSPTVTYWDNTVTGDELINNHDSNT